MRRYVLAATLVFGLFGAYAIRALAVEEIPIYSFAGQPDGANPESNLIVDSKTGIIYGTTYNGGANGLGTVFELLPPSAGSSTWTEKVIHSFGSGLDGANPWGTLVEDPRSGTLYGVTSGGGTNYYIANVNGTNVNRCCDGAAFEMMPPSTAGGLWTYAVIYDFGVAGAELAAPEPNGLIPSGPLALDSSGNLYGITSNGGANPQVNAGVAFELSPSKIGTNILWPETVLYNFPMSCTYGNSTQLSLGGLFIDSTTGDIYGSDSDAGLAQQCPWGFVFQLVPPSSAGGAWTENDLHDFQGVFSGTSSDGDVPAGALAFVKGIIYGTTELAGTYEEGGVFQVSPSVSPRSLDESMIYNFLGGNDGAQPQGGLIAVNGAFYGTTSTAGAANNGTIFMISLVSGAWLERPEYSFQGGMGDGADPQAALTFAPSGPSNAQPIFYGTTYSGGTSGNGTVFEASLPLATTTNSKGLSVSAFCDIYCFNESLGWPLLPWRWAVTPSLNLNDLNDAFGISSPRLQQF